MHVSVDTIVDAGWVIPVDPLGVVLQGHSIVVHDGLIAALAPTPEIDSRFKTADRLSLRDHVLLPGFVNLHTHAAMCLMRGLADDLPLMDWLRNHIWPAEMRVVSRDFVYDGTLLACAEMLRGGITCFNDMYFYPDASAEAALHAGMRAAVGMIVIEMPSPYAADARDYLAKGLALRDALRNEPLLSFCIAPHAPYTVSDATLERVATYSAELDLTVHIHLHETRDEITESMKLHGKRPLTRLRELQLLNPSLLAVHAVHLEPTEIAELAAHGCNVAHCPSSNLKLASGIAPVPAMQARGVNVGLGTDGAASNNRLDVVTEMRTAAMLGKGSTGDATAISAHRAIEMATLAGARALGLEDTIGTLTVGKRADMIAIDFSPLELVPCFDAASHVVYAAERGHVSHVWVDGQARVRDHELVAFDAPRARARATYWKNRMMQ